MPRLTQQQIESIPELYKNGLNTRKIGEQLNCSHYTIRTYLKKKNIEPRTRKKLTLVQINSIPDLYNSGLDTYIIAKKLNCDAETIRYHLIQKGIKRREKYTPKNTGKTELNQLIRKNVESKKWKKEVIKRDKYTCTECNQRGGTLDIDHIIPLSFLIKKYNIKKDNYKDFIHLLVDINNGRTLCKSCHKKTNTYGTKATHYKE